MTIIKLYQNGKLYDTDISRYVSLGDVSSRPHGSYEVIHNRTKAVVTYYVLEMAKAKLSLANTRNDVKGTLLRLLTISV